MPAVTIRNLSAEAHRALKQRAARHGRSTEAEIRAILEQAALPAERIRLGTLLAKIGRDAGLTDEDCAVFDQLRDRTPSEPPGFE
jgi:plasmid stability protein